MKLQDAVIQDHKPLRYCIVTVFMNTKISQKSSIMTCLTSFQHSDYESSRPFAIFVRRSRVQDQQGGYRQDVFPWTCSYVGFDEVCKSEEGVIPIT